MRYRMTFAVGMAIGYVLGSRAGRERYEQIKRTAQRVADSPRVQEVAGVMGAQVSKVAATARTKAGDKLRQCRASFRGSRDHESGVGWPDEEITDQKARDSDIPY